LVAGGYYDQVNPDLLYRIPVWAKCVLEVGCGAGALGAAYKTINPEATVVGLELNPEQAESARTRIDHVITGDVDRHATPSLPAGLGTGASPVDCLVYGDVLEHLRDPEAVLRQQLQWLAPDGLVVACIPNVQHWSVFLQLFSGHWPQQDQGLFDRTHLRWFTRESIIQLMQRCGLVVHDITPRIFRPEQAKAVVDALAPALPALGVDSQALLQGMSPLQYVVRAGRQPARPLLLSGLMLKPHLGMNEVRMLQPLRSVASTAGVVMELSHEQLALVPASSDLPRVLIFQRQALTYANSLPLLRNALHSGAVLVGEYDDDPSRYPDTAANHYLKFRAMHAMQVSTVPLAETIRPHNPETVVFDNAVESLPPHPVTWPEPGDGQPLRLFFGAANRGADWAPWMAALNQVLAADPSGWWVEVVHDQPFFEALHTQQKTFTPTCGYQRYQEVMGRCHVAFLPLADTPFNRMKSDLKLVEAASFGLAALASPVVYGDTFASGCAGVLFHSEQELMAALLQFRADPQSGCQLGLAARSWVRDHRLQKFQSRRREQWYRQLWQRREELTAALLERVPELRQA
jgi:2-polyprenyl-3-methyl-5-hydroxy-6-metoxy-1,4-benzoquinol methylase